ncbi:MAG: hypothetical protein NTX25_10230 [Proteobacteria bacterium]|nr:hypothetical protein [Pseudomonadota bacterium]
MPRATVLVGIAIAMVTTSCLSAFFGSKDSKSRDYEFPELGDGWELIDPGDADIAYRNTQDQSILNISSACGEGRFQTLEKLAAEILKQLPAYEVQQPAQSTTIGGFPSLITEVRGSIDGKPLYVRFAVVRTSRCLFDIILAGSNFGSSSRLAFEKTLSGFRVRSSL